MAKNVVFGYSGPVRARMARAFLEAHDQGAARSPWCEPATSTAQIRAPSRFRKLLVAVHRSRGLIDTYDAEIRFLDDQLRSLLERLENWGLLENTVVAIVGDHGESFGEHFHLSHGNGVYQSEVRVPLILSMPSSRSAERVERKVHLVDVMTTLARVFATLANRSVPISGVRPSTLVADEVQRQKCRAVDDSGPSERS